MIIFNQSGNWHDKVNFVDKYNRFVGYNLSQNCCEKAGWFISDKIENTIPKDERHGEDVSKYSFEQSEAMVNIKNESEFDGGGMVAFPITNGKKKLYIHIYNHHNGYYCHGFEVGYIQKNEMVSEYTGVV